MRERIAALESHVRRLRDGLKECADPVEGWPETWIADAFEESLALVPDEMPTCPGCADGECPLHLGTPSHLGVPDETTGGE
jgi:predicted nuclease with TOPRIM domain